MGTPLEPWVSEAIRTALPGHRLRDKLIPRCPRCHWRQSGEKPDRIGGSYVVCEKCHKIYNR